ncbi:ABC transporter ATP-binding protein [Candidatus Uabimicrobium amorphum]|uniref:Lipid A export permease/ATP-binding protein MsbA n=1 Tax=Uabimicrobium amorphum TaxID=2596890 RepID=A0A5S9ILE4_UABAM|nr:ABC transporter ATP-binding protein [Candidatus Uabimicrobium amorphum]BBM82725.1 lipid A export permease/ATP-binding protein MsbA [Candidatus Uabimicrobium amorphum]
MKSSESMNFNVYIRLIKYVRPYLKIAIFCFVLSILISVVQLGSLALLNPLGDILFEKDGTQTIFNKLVTLGDWGVSVANYLKAHVFSNKFTTLYLVMGCVAILTVLKGILRFTHDYLSAYISDKVVLDIRRDMYNKIINHSVRFFDKIGLEQVSSRFTNDASGVKKGIKSIFGKAMREPLKAVSSLAICLWLQWKVTIFIFVVFPIAYIFIRNLGKRVKKRTKKDLQKNADILETIMESFRGLKLIKAYQMEQQFIDKFEKENEKAFRARLKLATVEAITSPVMETFVTLAAVVLLIFSAELVLSGEMSSGDFLLFYGALGAIFDPVRKLADVYNRISGCIGAGERIFEFIDQPYEVKEKPDAVVLPKLQKEIEFRNVDFCYESHNKVLENISFSVNKGEIIAIVGKNGSGKSTLISLLLRFFDPTSGEILIDGQKITDVTVDSLRSHFSLVTQKAMLFNSSILNNIKCSSDASEEQIAEAGKLTHSHDFVDKLENGYHTLYGKGGIGLSGGQEQRIALARAIVRHADILILDEATANLDVDSEHYIKEALDSYLQSCTAFIIAHRFTTIQKADRILVLDRGKIEAFGSHEEIIDKSPTYKTLYEKQDFS